ncbi:hypothetical protein B194_5223 [Serratia plymuthica A30]|nr:hypothetical protein B194_5223 [Serratia plymuthica A30]
MIFYLVSKFHVSGEERLFHLATFLSNRQLTLFLAKKHQNRRIF